MARMTGASILCESPLIVHRSLHLVSNGCLVEDMRPIGELCGPDDILAVRDLPSLLC